MIVDRMETNGFGDYGTRYRKALWDPGDGMEGQPLPQEEIFFRSHGSQDQAKDNRLSVVTTNVGAAITGEQSRVWHYGPTGTESWSDLLNEYTRWYMAATFDGWDIMVPSRSTGGSLAMRFWQATDGSPSSGSGVLSNVFRWDSVSNAVNTPDYQVQLIQKEDAGQLDLVFFNLSGSFEAQVENVHTISSSTCQGQCSRILYAHDRLVLVYTDGGTISLEEVCLDP
jgi:hypothetical protein